MKERVGLKLFLAFIALTVLGLGFLPAAFAASQKIMTVSAEILANSPQIDVTILKFTDGNPDQDPWTNSQEVQSLDFGQLTYLIDNASAGLFYSTAGFCVVLFAESFGKPYDIISSCAGISNEQGIYLKSGSFGLIPVYSSTDKWIYPGGEKEQGDMPGNGAALGAAGSAVGDKIIYTSESSSATPRILQAYYGLPPYKAGGADPFPGYAPIELTQAPGRYTGTVTVTISLK